MRYAIIVLMLLLGSCGHGPSITVCASFPPEGLVCVDPSGKQIIVPYEQTIGYAAFPPADIKTLLNYCGLKGKEQTDILDYYQKALSPHGPAK